ncbi:MAG: citrate transporter [Bacillota bacterium]|nr:MAG: citrate transporter [Bacillota bacterium]
MLLLSNQSIAVLVFGITYLLLIVNRDRALIFVWGASIILLALRVISPLDAWQALNWNVLGILFGTMVLAEFFVLSGAPAYMATRMVNATGSATFALLAITAFAGFLSAFIENVATVFIVAPLAIETARRIKVSPVPVLLAVAVSANLQGVSTMIGDSPSILLATAARMTFMDFFFMNGRLGIFFAVQIGGIAAAAILWFIFRGARGKISKREAPKVATWTPTMLIVFLVIALASSSFIPNRPETLPGLVTTIFGVLALAWNHRRKLFQMELAKLDWQTFFLLAGLFVLISSLTVSGAVASVANLMTEFAGASVLTAYILIIVASVVISAFVDNIPYTIAMLPVSQLIAERMGVNPLLFMFALVLSTSLGGNITPIGASANVVAVGVLKRQGYKVSFMEFFKIGFPVTIAAVTLGTMFLWFTWR